MFKKTSYLLIYKMVTSFSGSISFDSIFDKIILAHETKLSLTFEKFLADVSI